jgi:hypothetical protein
LVGVGHAQTLFFVSSYASTISIYFFALFFAEFDRSWRVHSGEHALTSGRHWNAVEQIGQTFATDRRGVNLPDRCNTADDLRVVIF